MIYNTENGEIVQMGMLRARYLLENPDQTTYEDIHLLYICQHVAMSEPVGSIEKNLERMNERVTKEWVKRNEKRL